MESMNSKSTLKAIGVIYGVVEVFQDNKRNIIIPCDSWTKGKPKMHKFDYKN